MGLLGDSWEDPRTAAILNLAGGLLSQRNLGAGLVQGMQGYTSAMLAAKKAQQEEEERKAALAQRAAQELRAQQQFVMQQQLGGLQLNQAARADAEAQAQAARDDAFRSSIPSPQGQALRALGADASPTAANAARMPQVDPRNQFLFEALQARQIKPMEYLTATQKDSAPIKVSAGEALVDPRTMKSVFTNPKAEDTPAAIREYNFAVQQGYKGTFQQFDAERRRAGATNVNVPINTNKPLLNTMAEGLGKQIDANLGAARAAVETIGGAQRIRTLLDSGQVVTGPGADWRIAARQVGSALGVGGKNNDEVLANTRQVIQQLAQSELEAAQGMKGQGALTEAEREILRRAASGLITYTSPELKALSTTLEDRARKRIRTHNLDVDRLSQMPEGAQLVPFYRVPEPGTGNTVDDIVNRYRSR